MHRRPRRTARPASPPTPRGRRNRAPLPAELRRAERLRAELLPESLLPVAERLDRIGAKTQLARVMDVEEARDNLRRQEVIRFLLGEAGKRQERGEQSPAVAVPQSHAAGREEMQPGGRQIAGSEREIPEMLPGHRRSREVPVGFVNRQRLFEERSGLVRRPLHHRGPADVPERLGLGQRIAHLSAEVQVFPVMNQRRFMIPA